MDGAIMNLLPAVLFNHEILDPEISVFCARDPEFVQAEQRFHEAAQQIQELVGLDQYDTFEKTFTRYLYRTADLYYLYGLGLRQEILQALGHAGLF